MRDIRFRHYDGKYMQYSDEFLSLADYFSFFKEFKKDELQYTGIDDKNGKPIFEGDVLRHQYADSTFVKNYKHGFFLFYTNDNTLSTMNIDNKQLEVIGNIYENHELLDKQT